MLRKSPIFHYIRSFRGRSVFLHTLRSALLLFIIPMLFLTAYVYYTSASAVDRKNLDSAVSTVHRICVTSDSVLNSAKTLAASTEINSQNTLFIYSSKETEQLRTSFERSICEYIANFMQVNSYIDSMYIYSEINGHIINSKYICPLSEFDDTGWLDSFGSLTSPQTLFMRRSHDNGYPHYITVLRPVFNNVGKKVGAVVINLNIEYVSPLSVDPAQKLFIMNGNSVVYSGDDSFDISPYTNYEDGFSGYIPGKSVLAVKDSEALGLKYIYISENTQSRPGLFPTIIYTLILSTLTAVIFAILISVKAYEPLSSIISYIDSTEIAAAKTDTSNGEIRYIIQNIASTLNKKTAMEHELERRLTLLKSAQTKALQSQINPHFLYNTLENINMFAVELLGNKNPVSSIIISLAKLFKISADTNNYLVTLRDELSYSEEYIKILQIRTDNKFTVTLDIPPELYDCLTVKLSLQPLLENAVSHGIKFLPSDGKITISAYKSKYGITICVCDNGIGIESHMRSYLNKQFSAEYADDIKYLGLKNTNQRIKLVFGLDYGIVIDEKVTEGCKIYINQPYITQVDE